MPKTSPPPVKKRQTPPRHAQRRIHTSMLVWTMTCNLVLLNMRDGLLLYDVELYVEIVLQFPSEHIISSC